MTTSVCSVESYYGDLSGFLSPVLNISGYSFLEYINKHFLDFSVVSCPRGHFCCAESRTADIRTGKMPYLEGSERYAYTTVNATS